MTTHKVTIANFGSCSDGQIVSACKEILEPHLPETLRVAARRVLTSKKPDVMVAGKILWAHLCGQKPFWIKPSKS